MQKIVKRISFALLLAVPLALSFSKDSNLTLLESDVVYKDNKLSNDTSTHEHDNSWNILTKELVNENEGVLEGTTNEDDTTYYYLSDDVTLDSYDITINGNVSLCLNGQVLEGTGSSSVITVASNANFILYDCVGTEENTEYAHNYYVNSNGLYVFEDCGDNCETHDTHDVIYGGLITGGTGQQASGYKRGGGLYIDSDGTFIMEGGTISGNTATSGYGAGVELNDSGYFTMNGGSISGNAGNYGAGINVNSNDGNFTMNGGVISNNRGMNGGGLRLAGKFVMDGGLITGNISSSGNGNGLYLISTSSATIKNGTITDTVYLFYMSSAFNMAGGYLSANISKQDANASINITGGYFSYDPSDYLNSSYISLDIEAMGGKNFDDDYVDGFKYAVYKHDESFFSNTPEFRIIEDITYCADLYYEDKIKINVNYVTIVYSSNSFDVNNGFPTDVGVYEVSAYLDNVLIEYDGEKVYCSEASAGFTITINESHTPNVKKENEVEPKCLESGSYDSVTYCTVCETELGRQEVTVDATGHTPDTPTIENVVNPKCLEDGSYDSVTYCLECKTELNRVKVTVDATGHYISYDNENGYWSCSICNAKFNKTTDEDTSDVLDDTGSTNTPNGDATTKPNIDTNDPTIEEDPRDNPDDTDNPKIDEPIYLEEDGLSGGDIAGIVIGSLLGAAALAYGVCALLYMKNIVKGKFFETIYPFIKK